MDCYESTSKSGGLSVVADNLQLRPTPQRYCKAARAILVCYCTIEALRAVRGGLPRRFSLEGGTLL